ncbi:MAG: CDP-diacylglycerol--serine O-phosphatidyltransferase, partial [Prosthecobacter sp.]
YPSFKAVNWRTKRSFHWVLISIVVIAFTVMNWHWMPAVIFVSYLLYGLVRPWVSRQWRQEIEIELETPEVDVEVETLALNGGAEGENRPPDPATQI